MSGLVTVLNIAQSALAASQYGMDVTSHNIANVNTNGYSRQRPVFSANQPILSDGVVLGQGVGSTQIIKDSNQFIEQQLTQEKSNMESSQEMEYYMQILEGLFNENSEAGLSTMLSDFWNRWHAISNNPSGASERIALYQHSELMVEQMNALDANLMQLETDLTNAVGVGVSKINQMTEEIAQLNDQIVRTEINGVANDLRDQRNAAVSELADYIGIKFFEQDDGSLTILTARGCVLVSENKSYDLELGGDSGDRIKWQGSGGLTVDITDHINAGKIDGWLGMRDEVVAKCRLDLDALVNEWIWSVNQQHSQGVGRKLFELDSGLTGTYQTSTNLGDLEFGPKIEFISDGFKLWLEDRTDPANPSIGYVSIDLSGLTSSSTLSDLAATMNNQLTIAGLTGITVDGTGTALKFTPANDFAFGFSDDQSNILAALGVNTYFDGSGASTIAVNSIMNDTDYVAAGRINVDGSYTSGDNTNALAMTDLQYASREIAQWTCDRVNGNSEGSATATLESYYHAMVASIGSISSSISRGRDFSEVIVNNLMGLRDSISSVSLDEEMTNLIKFQHAYAAASKLVTVSDEMLATLLEIR
jgi:flagellar hook-associated protein 1 FlgK